MWCVMGAVRGVAVGFGEGRWVGAHVETGLGFVLGAVEEGAEGGGGGLWVGPPFAG